MARKTEWTKMSRLIGGTWSGAADQTVSFMLIKVS